MPTLNICNIPSHVHYVSERFHNCYEEAENALAVSKGENKDDAGFESKPRKMDHDRFQQMARVQVLSYVRARMEKTDRITLDPNDVYVVQFSKVLQNWKALVSTNLPDGMYYEVTFNGDKNVVYLDAYKKFDNIEVSLGVDIPSPGIFTTEEDLPCMRYEHSSLCCEVEKG